jgi:hypothetical protein
MRLWSTSTFDQIDGGITLSLGHDRPAEVLCALTAMALKSKKGKNLTSHVFLKMLLNPVYIGVGRS